MSRSDQSYDSKDSTESTGFVYESDTTKDTLRRASRRVHRVHL